MLLTINESHQLFLGNRDMSMVRMGRGQAEGNFTCIEYCTRPGSVLFLVFHRFEQACSPMHARFNIKKISRVVILAVNHRAGYGCYFCLCMNISTCRVSGLDKSPRDNEDHSSKKSHLVLE